VKRSCVLRLACLCPCRSCWVNCRRRTRRRHHPRQALVVPVAIHRRLLCRFRCPPLLVNRSLAAGAAPLRHLTPPSRRRHCSCSAESDDGERREPCCSSPMRCCALCRRAMAVCYSTDVPASFLTPCCVASSPLLLPSHSSPHSLACCACAAHRCIVLQTSAVMRQNTLSHRLLSISLSYHFLSSYPRVACTLILASTEFSLPLARSHALRQHTLSSLVLSKVRSLCHIARCPRSCLLAARAIVVPCAQRTLCLLLCCRSIQRFPSSQSDGCDPPGRNPFSGFGSTSRGLTPLRTLSTAAE
jgi:hypothetical protein